MVNKNNLKFGIFVIIFLLSLSAVMAIPPKPTEFYGTGRFFNANVPPGAVIRAYDSNGTMCGIFSVVYFGYYGTLSCEGDDPDTPVDEGAEPGDVITFKISIHDTTRFGSSICECAS